MTAMKINHALLLTITLCISSAQATLVKTDFLNPNDGLIVKDTATNYEWLAPLYTRGQVYNSPFVQSVISNYGFRYATAPEVTSLINTNFGNPTTTAPGDLAGFNSAAQFFSVFGINQSVFCSAGPCPRTQGLTSTPGFSGTRLAFGMIQLGPTGYFISNNNWPVNAPDLQMGSWLIRPAAETGVPEPSTTALIGLGLVLVASHRRIRRSCSNR
jgi:hypothetical protein